MQKCNICTCSYSLSSMTNELKKKKRIDLPLETLSSLSGRILAFRKLHALTTALTINDSEQSSWAKIAI